MPKQKFYYLGKGRQSYVFESENGDLVLKLARWHKYQGPLLYDEGKKVKKERLERIERAFSSYEIAFEKLKQDTNLLAFHLPHRGKCEKIFIYDKMGRPFILDGKNVAFLIQKKGYPFDEEFKRKRDLKDEKGMRDLVESFATMVRERGQKGIANRDFLNALRNDGVLDGKVFEMDVGSFYYDDGNIFEREIQVLRDFMKVEAPEYRMEDF